MCATRWPGWSMSPGATTGSWPAGVTATPTAKGAACIPAWRALPWLALLLFPLGLLHRSTRLASSVLLVQNLFYLWAYLVTPFDRELLIITSYPRLLAQVVPTMLALGLLALAQRARSDSQAEAVAA